MASTVADLTATSSLSACRFFISYSNNLYRLTLAMKEMGTIIHCIHAPMDAEEYFVNVFNRSEPKPTGSTDPVIPNDPVRTLDQLRKDLATSEWRAAVAPMHEANDAARNAHRLRAEIAWLEKIIASQSEAS